MFIPKLFTCLKNYTKEQFIQDLTAGTIVAVIAFPLSIALAIASGVSPEKGLHTAIIGGFMISFLGGSRVQIGGPTGAFIIIVFGIIQNYGLNGLIISTLIAGVILLLMGFLRFGNMIKYIPYPITAGFTSGIAITIFSTQIKDFLGLKMTEVPSEFIPKWIEYFKTLPTINYLSLGIGIIALIIIILWPKINKKLPGTLIAIIVTTVVALIFKLPIETIGSRFGTISAELPKFVMPVLDFATIKNLLLPGLTIAILAGIESLLSAVVADGMIGSKHRSNMELVAQGAANITSALFGGIPVTGAIARTAANIKNGGRTPVAGIVHAVVLLLIMVLFLPYMKLVPMATLAAILIVVSYNMGEWETFKMLKKAPKSDASIFLVTFGLTIFLDLVYAIVVGVVLASFLFMRRMAEVTEVKSILDINDEDDSNENMTNQSNENIAFYEISGPFFFGAADKFIAVVNDMNFKSKVLVLKMSHVPAMDATAYHGIEMLLNTCKKHNTKLLFSEVQPQPMQVMTKYGFIIEAGEANFCTSIDMAIERANKLITEMNVKTKGVSV